jgi:glyoxylate reductase
MVAAKRPDPAPDNKRGARRLPVCVLSDPLLPDVVDRFRSHLDLRVCPPGPALKAALPEADALIVLLSVAVDGALLDEAPRLKVVGNYAVGVDNVDLHACRKRRVAVVNTPDVLTHSTAELALTLLLSVARRVGEGERLVRRGGWDGWAPTQLLGTELRGKRAVIVGAGRIGEATAELFGALGLIVTRIGRHDPASRVTALLEEADVVSLHLPLSDATRHWLNAERLGHLKDGAIVINTARGGVVDEDALVRELVSGRLRAGLDVYDREPSVPEALWALDNVVLLPHLGSATRTAREGMATKVLDGVTAVLLGELPDNRVV